MSTRLGLYSIADTPEELLSRGYGYGREIPMNQLSEEEQNIILSKYDPAFGTLNTDSGYFPAPYTGAIPFQNVSFLRGDRLGLGFNADLTDPSFGGISGYRDVGGGITELDLSNEDDDIDSIYNDESFDVPPEQTGIRKLLQYLPFGDKSLFKRGFEGISNLIPRNDPRTRSMQNFYGSRFGLTPTGSVASGIMAGYNPVSGFGENKKFGLGEAIADRIAKRSTIGQERINKRFGKDSERAKQFAAKTQELINLAKEERGSKSSDKAFDRDRTREKDLRGGSGKNFGPYS